MGKAPNIRLLPATIVTIAALLAFKSVGLVRTALPTDKPNGLMFASAAAAEKAAPAHGEKTEAKHGEAKGEKPAQPAEAAAPPPPPMPPPIPDSERTVLLELRERRQELDARESGLSARESVLAAAEQKLTMRVAELTNLQRRLEALEAGRSQREEASWQGLVKVYETMKPRDAAAIFNELDEPVLLNVVDRMKDSKAAPVIAAMNTDKARDITAKLAELRSKRNAPLGPPGAASTASSAPPASPVTTPGRPKTPG